MIIIDDYNEKNYLQKFIIAFLYLFKFRIFFINTTSNNISKKIKPIPLENIGWINCQEDSDSDIFQKGFRNLEKLLTKKMSANIIYLFENSICHEEIERVLKRQLAWTYTSMNKKVDLFYDKYNSNKDKKEKFYLLIFNKKNFILPLFENKINFYRLIFFEEINIILNKIFNKFSFISKSLNEKNKNSKFLKQDNFKKKNFDIFHIWHDGFNYGKGQNMWDKDYLNFKLLNKKKIAFIDYVKNYNLKNIDYFYISPRFIELKNFITFKLLSKILKILINLRSFDDFFIFSYFNRLLLEKKFYVYKFSKFTNVKYSIIDYPELCPFPIIFALKQLNIKTIGIQQRFINFNYSYCQLILDFYLVNSRLIKEKLKNYKNIKKIIVVGQWRTKFLKNKKINFKKKIKKITALTYFYWMNKNYSQTQITVNDKNSDYFLDQLIKLSYQLENTQISLKFKSIEWIKGSLIADDFFTKRLLNKLKQNKRIKIENTMSSYDSCLNSDLVIAKPTSLCDELISQKIPTLISLDSNNFKIKKNTTYNYFHKDILVSSYNELLIKTKKILNNDNYFKSIYLNSSRKLYDNGIFNNSNKLTNEINNIIEKKFERST